MSTKVSVTIKNNSGYAQTYVVFAEPPNITPAPENIQTNVMFSLRGVAGDGGQAYFTLPVKGLHALCGTSDGSAKEELVQFEVLDNVRVNLETQVDEGKLLPGTTCEVMVSDGTPRFTENQISTALGMEGAFCVKTRRDFTYKEAVAGRFVLGLGVSAQLVDEIGPQALFVPHPNQQYMIKPSRTVHVAIGRMNSRDMVTPDLRERACAIDFDQMQSLHALLVHTKDGALVRHIPAQL